LLIIKAYTTKRLWLKYIISSTVIKIIRDERPTVLHNMIMKNLYFKRRCNSPSILNRSSEKCGERSISNWTGPILYQIKEPWCGTNLSDDQLRRPLKKTFYTQS